MKQRNDFLAFKLSEVNDLSLIIWICKIKLEQDLKIRLGEFGCRVLLSTTAKGVSRKPILEILGLVSQDVQIIFSIARKQDVDSIINSVASQFDFSKPGNGKAFAVDIDGYLGAKGLLVEG